MAGELPAVPEVVPDAVETAGDAAEGIEESVAAPDEEDGVLLA